MLQGKISDCRARHSWETDRNVGIIENGKSHAKESKGSGHCPEHKLKAREWTVVVKLKQKHVFSIISSQVDFFYVGCRKDMFLCHPCPLTAFVPREVSVKGDCSQHWRSGRGVCAYLSSLGLREPAWGVSEESLHLENVIQRLREDNDTVYLHLMTALKPQVQHISAQQLSEVPRAADPQRAVWQHKKKDIWILLLILHLVISQTPMRKIKPITTTMIALSKNYQN